MADKKISALTAASLPLAGTEVLPIVQSGATVKVATDNLTVKNVRANGTTGILQVTGPAAASTRVMTVPDANFTAARTDAANSFTGDQTLATGNLIQGTAAKGMNFSANTGTGGKTSSLLNWYEEGTWTPGAGNLTVVGAFSSSGTYTRIGRLVTVQATLTGATSIAGGGGTFFTGLPFTPASISAGSLVAVNRGAGCQVEAYTNGNVYVTGFGAIGTVYVTVSYEV